MASVKNFLGDAAAYGIGAGIKKFMGLLILPFYTRVLTPNEYGVIDVLANGVFFVSVVCTLGLNGASSRFYFMAKTQKEKGEILFTSLFIRLCFSFLIILLLMPFSTDISSLLFKSEDYSGAVLLSLLLVPMSIISEDQTNIFRYSRKPIQFNIATIFQSLLNIGLGIYLVLFLHKGVYGVNMASLLSSFLLMAIIFITFTKNIYRFRFNFSYAKKMLVYGFPLIGTAILGWFYSVSDRYFLLYFQDLPQIGLFSIGNTFSQPLLLINTAVLMSQGVLITSSYEDEVDDEKPKTKNLINRIIQVYLLIGVSLIAGLSIFGTILLEHITTVEYIPGAIVIPLMGFSSIFTVLFVLTGFGMDLKLKTKYYFWLMLIAASTNIVLNFYFIPVFGFVGAGITTLFSNVLYFSMAYYYSQKFFYVKRKLLPILLYLAIAFGVSVLVPIMELYLLIQIGILLKLILWANVLILSFLLNIISISEIKQLIKTFSKQKI